jgi:AcrR family transcriptional regulator
MTQKSYHHGELRKALVDTALQVINTEGKEKLTFRRLGKELGVSAMAPFRHFENKEQLLQTAAKQGFELLIEQNQKITEQDPKKRLIRQGIVYVEFALSNPAHYRLMFANDDSQTWNDELKQAADEAFSQMLVSVQICAATRSLSRNMDEMTAALICWTQVHGTADLFATSSLGNEIDPAHFAFQACSTVVNGLFSNKESNQC